MDRQEKILKEIQRFKDGFPWMDIVAPATPSNGISVLDSEEQEKAVMDRDKTRELIGDKNVIKVVSVPGKLVNIVVKYPEYWNFNQLNI